MPGWSTAAEVTPGLLTCMDMPAGFLLEPSCLSPESGDIRKRASLLALTWQASLRPGPAHAQQHGLGFLALHKATELQLSKLTRFAIRTCTFMLQTDKTESKYSINLALEMAGLQEHLLIAEQSSDTQAGAADTLASHFAKAMSLDCCLMCWS